MPRGFYCRLTFCFAAALSVTQSVRSADDPPQQYDVSINGENFTVESGRVTRLQSKDQPGTSYRVAVQLAQLQLCRLNRLQFLYQRAFVLVDDRKTEVRSVTLKHPLGFAAVVTDLGGPLPAADRKSTLKLLSDASARELKSITGAEVTVSQPESRKLGTNQITAVTLGSNDSQRVQHGSIVYLVTGEKFTCSCLLRFQEADRDDAIDIFDATLGSLTPIP